MTDDLHRSIWFAYRRAIGRDASWDAATAFQATLDVYLGRRPGIDAASACRDVARMIMTRPRGVANRGRVVAAAGAHEVASREAAGHMALVAVGRFASARALRPAQH